MESWSGSLLRSCGEFGVGHCRSVDLFKGVLQLLSCSVGRRGKSLWPSRTWLYGAGARMGQREQGLMLGSGRRGVCLEMLEWFLNMGTWIRQVGRWGWPAFGFGSCGLDYVKIELQGGSLWEGMSLRSPGQGDSWHGVVLRVLLRVLRCWAWLGGWFPRPAAHLLVGKLWSWAGFIWKIL